ncbi:hypothetical protein CC80DRAFT_507682 [Byssothecium circinans]|uniref:Uncharacterized protein n=1 Tax=Byssothecium circinans TaxID=147558 RepID=A0A6A5TKL5_9PLEO|nr:hypothetical protein CC80DRAFT_507682 [Byssothecium circinans]
MYTSSSLGGSIFRANTVAGGVLKAVGAIFGILEKSRGAPPAPDYAALKIRKNWDDKILEEVGGDEVQWFNTHTKDIYSETIRLKWFAYHMWNSFYGGNYLEGHSSLRDDGERVGWKSPRRTKSSRRPWHRQAIIRISRSGTGVTSTESVTSSPFHSSR